MKESRRKLSNLISDRTNEAVLDLDCSYWFEVRPIGKICHIERIESYLHISL